MEDGTTAMHRLLDGEKVSPEGQVPPLNGTDPSASEGPNRASVRRFLRKHFDTMALKSSTKTPRVARRPGRCRQCLRTNLLTLLTMFSVIGGIVLGISLRTRVKPWTPREIMYVTFPGDLFLRMLKSLILPLIVSSLVAALGGLDLKLSGKIGVRSVVYYMSTTIMAAVMGIILVMLIYPGRGDPDDFERVGSIRKVTTVDTLLDLVRSMFPSNLIEACIFQYRTVLTPPAPLPLMVNSTDVDIGLNSTMDMSGNTTMDLSGNTTFDIFGNATFNVSDNDTNIVTDQRTIYDWKISGENTEGTNVLGLVVFSIALGIAIGRMHEKGKPLQAFFHAFSEAMMMITGWIIWLSPLGIMFLVAGKMLEMKSYSVIIGQLGMYFLTVMVGLFIHGFIVIPLIYVVFTKTLPFRFIFNMLEALITAFGTSSSTASVPVTIRCLEDKNKLDRRVVRFVIPIGSTINMDGTALYEAVAAIFIAQVRRVEMDIGKIIAVSITATAASIGAAGIPQAGLVTMVMVLNAVGLPAEDVTLIIVVDWLLDRFRTMINVLGDSIGAGIVNHMSQADLASQPDIEVQSTEELPGKHVKSNGDAKCDEESEYQTTAM